jgi:DNA replication protein DnaC
VIDTSVSLSIFGVPRSHRHCTIENFRWPSSGVQEAVQQFMVNLLEGKRTSLLFTGSPGLGKSHLAVALYRWGVKRWGTGACALIQVPEFFHTVKQTFNQTDAPDAFLDIEDARQMVVLDDLLGRNPTPWELDHIIFRLINTGHMNGAALVVTTNFTRAEMQQILKPHEMSRIMDGTIHIEFRGADQRIG